MTLDIDSPENLYLRAKASYYKCVSDPSNEFLKNEIDVPIAEITLIEQHIRVQFFKHEVSKLIVEVKLLLARPDNTILGYYAYHEDENQICVDDSLVFD